eukprot:Skav231666  [mRNA]  locus=scaffold597:31770:32015:- [translate_table: standard]
MTLEFLVLETPQPLKIYIGSPDVCKSLCMEGGCSTRMPRPLSHASELSWVEITTLEKWGSLSSWPPCSGAVLMLGSNKCPS